MGPSSSGKSKVGKILKEKYKLPIVEVDDEVTGLNGGVWPEDEKIIDKYFDKVHKIFLKKDNIIFITSFLGEHEIKEFKKNGFKFVAIYAGFDFLLKRRIKRDQPDQKLIERFRKRYNALLEIIKSHPHLFEKIIDVSTQTPLEIADGIFAVFKNTS